MPTLQPQQLQIDYCKSAARAHGDLILIEINPHMHVKSSRMLPIAQGTACAAEASGYHYHARIQNPEWKL
jgi:hypothetical protein